MAAQPFGLSFEAADGSRREHVPDFFVRTVGGKAAVVDVRPDNLIDPVDEEKFAAAAELCGVHGWSYWRVGQMPSPWIENVRWLAGYRHGRACIPGRSPSSQVAQEDRQGPPRRCPHQAL